MDKTVQKINKVNGNYIPLILSPLYFTENNYKSIENDLKEFYQNHYLFIENNNADLWGSAAKMFNLNNNNLKKITNSNKNTNQAGMRILIIIMKMQFFAKL